MTSGKHFSVNEMVRKESVRTRLEAREQGISFTEFAYMLLQAWDFVQLFDRYGCTLAAGRQRPVGQHHRGHRPHPPAARRAGLRNHTPLITLPSGAKMGKSEGSTGCGSTRSARARTSSSSTGCGPTTHRSAATCGFFTFLDRDRIEELDRATAEHPERREAQQALAWEVTSLVHGEAEAAKAKHAAEVLFTEDVAGLDEATLLDVMADAPASDAASTESPWSTRW